MTQKLEVFKAGYMENSTIYNACLPALEIQAAKVIGSIQDKELEDENSKKTESDSEDLEEDEDA